MIRLEKSEFDRRNCTYIKHDENLKYNAPHTFMVLNAETNEPIQCIHFQKGPIKECGINGVSNEDLLNMVKCRLEHFQDSKFNCTENEKAIAHINAALECLYQRTNKREIRGVLGTSNA